MDPNGFIHINCFQNRCLQAKVHPSTRLFWFHYDFWKNAKSPGFYTIAHRAGRADWAYTNSGNKKMHTHSYFISGLKLAEFVLWRELDTSKVQMPELTAAEQNYAALVDLDVPQLSLSDARNKDWHFALWVAVTAAQVLFFFFCFHFAFVFQIPIFLVCLSPLLRFYFSILRVALVIHSILPCAFLMQCLPKKLWLNVRRRRPRIGRLRPIVR